jgi:acyl carrier protein
LGWHYGMIDRTARQVKATMSVESVSIAQQRGAQEEIVAGVWREILARDAIRVDDDFFSLGGDSVSMLNMLFRLHEIFQVELAPEILLKNPTLAQFTPQVSAALRRVASETAAVSLLPVEREEGTL